MRVLQVHCRYRLPGGEDAVVEREAALLRAAGHDVETLVVHNPESARTTAVALAAAPWNRAAAGRVREQALRVRPDVVHVHNTWFALSPAVLRAVRSAALPTVLSLHNYRLSCVSANFYRDGAPCFDCLGRSPAPGVRHRCYRGSAAASAAVAATVEVARLRRVWQRDVDAFAIPSARARELLVQSGVPASKAHVVPNVVADVPGRAEPAASSTVLYVGRLTPEKGLDVLLRAWTAAPPPGLRLVVVGGGPLDEVVRSAAGSGVELAGRLAPGEVVQRMQAARALVVPSVWDEPFGLVVAEAAAAGLPVLAASSGALPELLAASGSTGWLVPPGDAAAWGAALASLASGSLADDLEAAGRRARSAYELHWSLERGATRLVALYDSVTGT